MRYYIDHLREVDNNIKVIGWALPKDYTSFADFIVEDKNHNKIDFSLQRVERYDISATFLKNQIVENPNFGFELSFYIADNEQYNLYIKTKEKTVKIVLSKEIALNFNKKNDSKENIAFRRKQYLINLLQIDSIKRGFDILKKHGLKAYVRKLILKLKGINQNYNYNEWYNKTKITKKELDIERKEYRNNFKILPKFSIVIPIYNTNIELLKKLLFSIENQSYDNYELIIVDATNYSDINTNPKKVFDDIKNKNSDFSKKIIYKQIENKTISENTNEGIKYVSGDYVILSDHDDELTLDCLYEFTKTINEHECVNFIYSDEDKTDFKSLLYFEPNFKSDFNIDMLTSVNYISHIACIKKNIVDEIINIYGSFEREEYNGAQDYDLYLRIVNLLISKNQINTIYHIPKVLYHWRSFEGSTSYKTNEKTYAISSGEKCLLDYYKHSNIEYPEVEKIEKGIKEGFYHTIFKQKDYGLLSILIPNKDHIKDLDILLKSLEKSVYKNFEVVIVENNSTENETFEYYKNINNKYSFDTKVVYYKDKFNYSKINNFGMDFCDGEYILFLNNDMEMISEYSWIEMMDYIVRDDVGAVGCKLLYSDRTIQHAGVILGIGGIASHAFKNVFDLQSSFMNRAQIVQDLNAVTAASLLTKKSIMKELKGFDEDFEVAFNDIDLCMRIRRLNKLIVYNPYATFFHYESKTRGYEDTKAKVDRFNKEVARFIKRWQDDINKGDCYYNRNLTLLKEDFSLRDLDSENIGEPYKLDKEIYRIMEQL